MILLFHNLHGGILVKKTYRVMNSINNIKRIKYSSENNSFFDKKVSYIIDSLDDAHKLSKRSFLQRVFEATFKLIPEAEKGSFYELNDDKYIPIFSMNYDFELLKKLSFNKDEAFIDFECYDTSSIDAYQIYISKRDDSQFSEDVIKTFKELGTYSDFSSLYAPIKVNGVNLGLICLENFSGLGFKSFSKKILKFYAKLISNFYTQKILQEHEAEKYNEIVASLVSAIEVKDIYTEGHAQRVRDYSVSIASILKLSEESIQNISFAGLLHDVGKIGISTEILTKAGKLTEEEYEKVKLHPIYSKKILENISGFSNVVAYAYYHHERYDGLGYPEGINGKQIPIEAQIIQLADSYDAMTSKRSYRDALDKTEALKIIENESGKQFNPDIVKAALQLFAK